MTLNLSGIRWDPTGTEPSESRKNIGRAAGERYPAEEYNFYRNQYYLLFGLVSNMITQNSLDISNIEALISEFVDDTLFLNQGAFRFWDYFATSDEVDLPGSTNVTYNAGTKKMELGTTASLVFKTQTFSDFFEGIATRVYYDLPVITVESNVVNNDTFDVVVTEAPQLGDTIKIDGKLVTVLSATPL